MIVPCSRYNVGTTYKEAFCIISYFSGFFFHRETAITKVLISVDQKYLTES